MIINPIIPIWLMAVICVILLVLKRKGTIPYIRQIFIVVLIFIINLRVMVPDESVGSKAIELDAYVLFVVDDTISMLAQDYNGNTERLTAVKEDVSYIIDELYGARFSVIAFNNEAKLMSPFTNDDDFAKSVINSIYPLDELYAKGSSMNVSKELLINTAKGAYEKGDGSVIVFFISDGEINNEDKLSSFEEASSYIDNGAVLGYGTDEGGKMYIKSYYSDEITAVKDSYASSKDAISKIDEENLKNIARDMGLSYLNMNDKGNIDSIIKSIKNTSNVSQRDASSAGYKETYYIFVIPLLLLLIYEFINYKRRA